MAARRRQILDVAIELFSRRGLKGTTTREIAQLAGVNEALIFRHFARKEDLYAAILERGAHLGGTRQWLPELRGLADKGEDERLLATLFGRLIAQHDHDHDFLRLMLYSALEEHALTRMFYTEHVEPLQQFLLAYIKDRQRAGVFRRCDAASAVRAIIALPSHHVLVTRLLRWSAPPDDAAAVAAFTELVLHGLRTPRRRGAASATRAGARTGKGQQ